MPHEQLTIHCSNCNGTGKKKVTTKSHTKYRCNQCNLVVSNETKQCKNHPSVGSWPKEHKYSYMKNCRICSGTDQVEKPDPGVSTEENENEPPVDLGTDGIVKAFDSLHKTLKFDRKLLKVFNNMKKGKDPLQLINTTVNHIEKFKPQEAIQAFKEAWLPTEAINKITDETDCDKSVEKTQVSKIIMWTLSLFLQSKTEDLAIKYIAYTSATIIGREFGEGPSISDKTLGKRLENSNLINALEMMLTDRAGIVHITDRGPFSTGTMSEIRDNKQGFEIALYGDKTGFTNFFNYESF